MPLIPVLLVALAACFAGLPAHAETKSLLILHTNDLHDHLRPDYDGSGGISYVSGYIHEQRRLRNDVLVLDAGDVMEKGDLIAFATHSTMMYEAMRRIGYDAATPGNHDDAYGLDHLDACNALAPDMELICINLFHEDGSLRLPASTIVDINGLRIGIIGVTRPRDTLSMELEPTARAIREEARRFDANVDITIVVCHLGPKECETISRAAPEVDVFVSGHTHQALRRPLRIRETGAYIVQAGSYAEYVGRLDIDVDTETGELSRVEGALVEMVHADVPNDREMLKWIESSESDVSPEANGRVVTVDDPVGYKDLGFLAAEAFRVMGNVDIGFCHTGQVIRGRLPRGPIDVNAVFRTGGQRGFELVRTDLRGETINRYLNGLARSGWGQTHWSGFRAERIVRDGIKEIVSDLESSKTYSVIMARIEWDTRFMRYFERQHESTTDAQTQGIDSLTATTVEFSFTDAVVQLLKEADSRGLSPQNMADRIADASSSK